MAVVSVTFKAHGGYDAPWIIVKGLDGDPQKGTGAPLTAAESVSAVIEELRELGAFSAVKLIAQEFTEAPAAGVEAVQAAVPGAEQITPDASLTGTPTVSPPNQSLTPCETCGAATIFSSGTSDTGAWMKYQCSTGDKSHTKWMRG